MQEFKHQKNSQFQHYLHQQYLPNSARKLCRNYKKSNQNNQFILVNNNKLQIYSCSSGSPFYQCQRQFFCNIKVFQVIPSKHHQTDYILIADEMGRFLIYHQQYGNIYSHDVIDVSSIPPHLTYDQQIQKKQFSGLTYTFNVNDTQGFIMYTYSKMLVVISFVIKKVGLLVSKVSTTEIMLNGLRFAGVLSPSKNRHLIGLIDEAEQKTILRIVSMLKPLKEEWNIQKVNMLQFVSSGNEIAIMTYNQVSIYNYMKSQPICNFRIHQNWNSQICVLDPETYLHFGTEVIAFGKTGIRNYGTIKLDQTSDNHAFNQCRCLIRQNNAFTLFCSLLNGNSYFLSIGQKGWNLIKEFKTLSYIFTMTQDEATGNTLTVTQSAEQSFTVSEATSKLPLIVLQDQPIQCIIQKMVTVQNGKIIILSANDSTFSFIYNEITNSYQKGITLQHSCLVTATSEYIVLQNGIYGANYINKVTLVLSQSIKQAIVSSLQNYIGFLNEYGEFKVYSTEKQCIVSTRINAENQYLWVFWQNQVLCSDWKENNVVKVFSINGKKQSKMLTHENQMISDFVVHLFPNSQQLLLVGFSKGIIKIFTRQKTLYKTIKLNKFQPVSFLSCSHNILVRCGQWQILYQKHNDYLTSSIDLPANTSLAFCKNKNRLLMAQNSTLSFLQLPEGYFNFDTSIIPIQTVDKDPPFIICHQDQIYLVTIFELKIYHLRCKILLKKQIHILKDVRYVESLNKGILIAGVDDMDQGCLILFSWKDLEILFTLNLGTKRTPSCVKKYQTDKFIVRFQTSLSIYQIQSNLQPKEISSFFTNHHGYALDVNQQLERVIINDPLSYYIIYQITEKSFLPLTRYKRPYKIVDVSFLSKSVIYADRAGYLGITEFNLQNSNDIEKFNMSQVGCLYLSEQVFVFNRHKSDVYYGCKSGMIGRVRPISQSQFEILKHAQKEASSYGIGNEGLSYEKWRRRSYNVIQSDKIIDEGLLKYFIEKKVIFSSRNLELYNEVKKIYEQLINK